MPSPATELPPPHILIYISNAPRQCLLQDLGHVLERILEIEGANTGFGRSATRYSSASRRHVAFLGQCREIETPEEVRLIRYPTITTTAQPTML